MYMTGLERVPDPHQKKCWSEWSPGCRVRTLRHQDGSIKDNPPTWQQFWDSHHLLDSSPDKLSASCFLLYSPSRYPWSLFNVYENFSFLLSSNILYLPMNYCPLRVKASMKQRSIIPVSYLFLSDHYHPLWSISRAKPRGCPLVNSAGRGNNRESIHGRNFISQQFLDTKDIFWLSSLT